MAVSKVVYGGNTLIDLTGDTVAADKLLSGYTAHDAAGNAITGTATAGGGGLPAEIVAGDTPVLYATAGMVKATSTSSLTETSLSISISVAGTYRFYWSVYAPDVTCATQLYRNGTAVGTQQSTNSGVGTYHLDLACAAGDTVVVRLKGGTYWGATYGAAGGFVACIDWDNGF